MALNFENKPNDKSRLLETQDFLRWKDGVACF